MDDVRAAFLLLPHGATPAAVTTNKNTEMSYFKSSENIQKKEVEPDRSVLDIQSSSVTLKIVFSRNTLENLLTSCRH